MNALENNKLVETQALDIPNSKPSLLSEDIGKFFWRVEYQGRLSQYKIIEVFENGIGKFRIANLTNLQDGYKLKDELEYWSISEFGLDVIRKPEFYTCYKEAIKASKARYEKEVNPNGDYRVARYFDDVFEAWESGVINKKEAANKASELNRKPRHYVSYDIVAIS